MTLSYLRTLQRAWDRYALPGSNSNGPTTPRTRKRATEEVKVAHLNSFMKDNKLTGITIKDYEIKVQLASGNMVTYTKWLMTGRLPSVKPGELIEFFTARWKCNKNATREIAHVDT